MEDRRDFALGKKNFLILATAFLVIILGFCLMLGGASTEETGFNPDIFSTRRIVVAPIITVIGFCLVAVGILKKDKSKQD